MVSVNGGASDANLYLNVKLSSITRALMVVALAAGLNAHAVDNSPSGNQKNGVELPVHRLQARGVEIFFQLSDRLYSVSAPEGTNAFAELQKLGIKPIITVDGAKPDGEPARQYGMRYVH